MRLIDADVVLRSLPDDLPYKAAVKRVLIQAPTVDAVPVVRCEDCSYAVWSAWACKYACGQVRGLLVFGDHFCAFGKTRWDRLKTYEDMGLSPRAGSGD